MGDTTAVRGQPTTPPGGQPSPPDEDQASPPTFDLRLLCPALIAWATMVVLVVHDARTQLTAGLVALAAAGLVVRFRSRGRLLRWHHLGGLTALSCAATALVLIAGAAHRASDEVGPVADLAQERAVVTVTGTVLTEPRLVTRGDERPDLVIFELRIRQIEARGEVSRVSTPVVVFADDTWQDVSWRSTVTTRARLGPPDEGDSVVGVLTPLDPPGASSRQGLVLSGTEHVRERLRQSVHPLPVDARALIPGLVIGDTSLTPMDLKDAMLATGMSHLSAVSGSNVAIVLGAAVLLCGWCGVPRRWRPLIALLSLVGFVLLCRPEPSVLRAGAMGVVGLIALSSSRRAASLPALTVAVLATGPWLRWQAGRHPRVAWSLLLVGLALLWPTPGRHGWPPQHWVVAGCDVGQGDSFLVPTGPGRVVVIDTGPDPGLLGACLDLLGVRQVDALVLTHFHADHVGGLDAVLGQVPVAAAYVTPVRDPPADAERVLASLQAENIPTYAVTSGDQLVWGDAGRVRAQVVWPPSRPSISPGGGAPTPGGREPDLGRGANNGSVVLDLTVDGVRMLFTGDIEPEAARGVRRAVAGERFDVLKVAHHGSAAQDDGLVTGVGATVALIGVGEDNTFGHPSRTALSLLAETGTVVLRTDLDGTYAVVLDEGQLAVSARR
ncbi:ComEC/Rec2 family competence protein [Ornithinimicrobium cryptoxanthini]|uniref:ComEC/Rec2 family competence protein n=1 Tax=Ornithinimicrobium cryptoxanthini TaxID=2934161 RepID=A0ABY4YKL4_9MICO|nr:ComEC/Rec2 family competence protein [Ornithinimicrobium cryptoxanthini]USQ77274.1 ComEC/Rec2 family competence protein [Ornithinimicrobium cryptoxanthini]